MDGVTVRGPRKPVAAGRRPRSREPVLRPSADELRHQYIDEQRTLPDLAGEYRVDKSKVRNWLVEAGVTIRSRADAGRRRQLTPPPAGRLGQLAGSGRTVPQLAADLGVSAQTVHRWLREAGVAPPRTTLKDRPRGASTQVERPPASQLRQLYVDQHLSVVAIADQLAVSTHLVRTWLLEAGIALGPPGGRRGVARPSHPLKPVPPREELLRLREQQRWSLARVAEHYQVHPSTAVRWCRLHNLPTQLSAAGATDAELVAMYRNESIPAAEVARRAGVRADRVLRALHAAGVQLDPSRQADAVRRAGRARRGATPSLTDADASRAVAMYRDDGWTYQRIADELGVSFGRVRNELHRRGIPARRHPLTGPASRGSRGSAPVDEIRRLYVKSEWPAEEVGARINAPGWMVLRTAHAHGIPVRQGGRPVVSATVAVIEALYADPDVAAALDRHSVPRRPAGGHITDRFPDPVPLSRELLHDLYLEAGCSSSHIELLTGHPEAVVRTHLHRLAITFRSEHMSPALRRMRAAARAEFLTGVADTYRHLGSTRRVGEAYGCSPETVRRWLVLADVAVPGRGQWPRRRKGETNSDH